MAVPVIIWPAAWYVKAAIMAPQMKLRSLITKDTSISGFYGPGSWWAWLITLGMTHGHSLLGTREAGEWDYDLIAASGYNIVAAIDLILKARIIGRLGDSTCESPLFPALLCAERVVSVGTGSSLFTIAIAGWVPRSSDRRRLGVAIIPIVFALVASCFSYRAHEAILRTEPEHGCKLPDGSPLQSQISYILDAIPHSLLWVGKTFPVVYTGSYWLVVGAVTIVSAAATRCHDKLRWSGLALAGAVLLPLMIELALGGMVVSGFLGFWALLWAPQYILAFCPQMGFFPLTGTSVMDMDQLAALLSIGFIAALRSGRRILKALRNRADSSESAHELEPLYNEP
ncbi:hypothetical protein MSAN_01199800 [Mycena sanguinolenta]|uniref:Uncharacterized protein n=1 Tax=Mycena sanguinolenta TaxID=230812 RepID=A0A8H6YHX6_9AGAR|nr:hypothetical protein MSAN_01199800 [Mycena sanguinolenta]